MPRVEGKKLSNSVQNWIPMAIVLIRIEAPHFVAGYDMATGRIAPIIKYMRGWSIEKIIAYCQSKKWSVSIQ